MAEANYVLTAASETQVRESLYGKVKFSLGDLLVFLAPGDARNLADELRRAADRIDGTVPEPQSLHVDRIAAVQEWSR